jgi:hypothetical protein
MALSFYDAFLTSIVLGIFFGILVGVKYLVRIESRQKKTLDKILRLEELIVNAEKKILARLKSKKK